MEKFKFHFLFSTFQFPTNYFSISLNFWFGGTAYKAQRSYEPLIKIIMKRYLLLILLVKIPAIVFCQFEWIINFEDSTMFDRIVVDTLENPSNIWQIGQPSKENFNSAYSGPNAMITDTLNSYPINDTSSFIIKHYRAGSWGVSNYELTLQFWFKFDSDSINDYGTVEASFDNGLTWINLLIEDSIHYLNWIEQKPVLTGKSNEWQHFALDLVHLSYEYVYNDTTLFYRFTFTATAFKQIKTDGCLITSNSRIIGKV